LFSAPKVRRTEQKCPEGSLDYYTARHGEPFDFKARTSGRKCAEKSLDYYTLYGKQPDPPTRAG
jgi:hypothetical protein